MVLGAHGCKGQVYHGLAAYAEEMRGKKRVESAASSLPFPSLVSPVFFLVNFSTALYYLNAWNRLTRGWLCQKWKPLDKPGTHLH